MRKLFIHIGDFVYGWIPAHKRLTIRIQLFTKLMTPFTVMMAEYVTWRDASVTAAQVTGETLSLQWYLNQLFDVTNSITIETAPVSGVLAGLVSIPESPIVAGQVSVSETPVTVGLSIGTDIPIYYGKSFVVNVPTALTAQQDAIKAVVKKYKAAGKSFRINII
jgi:hypothetical protein